MPRNTDAGSRRIWNKYQEQNHNLGLKRDDRISLDHLDGLLRDIGIQPTRKVKCEFLTNYVAADYITFSDFRHFFRLKNQKSCGANDNVIVSESHPLIGQSIRASRTMPPDKRIYGCPSELREETAASSLSWSREPEGREGHRGVQRQRQKRLSESSSARRIDAHQSKDFFPRPTQPWLSKDPLQNLLREPPNQAKELTKSQRIRPKSNNEKETQMEHGLSHIFDKLQNGLRHRGIKGNFGLRRLFKEIDENGDGGLKFEEFVELCSSHSKGLKYPSSRADLRKAFKFLDVDDSGTISVKEFERIVQTPLTARRKRIVRKVFRAIDADDSGVVDVADLEASFNVSNHPDVITGMATKTQVLEAFLSHFSSTEKSGKNTMKAEVTYQDWEDFYTASSSFILDDEQFESIINMTWSSALGDDDVDGDAVEQAKQREQELENSQNHAALRRKKRGTRNYGAERTNMRRRAREAEEHDQNLDNERRQVEAWGSSAISGSPHRDARLYGSLRPSHSSGGVSSRKSLASLNSSQSSSRHGFQTGRHF
jgi:Ca2+-binding EF-hand superfamily protein